MWKYSKFEISNSSVRCNFGLAQKKNEIFHTAFDEQGNYYFIILYTSVIILDFTYNLSSPEKDEDKNTE